MIPTNTMRRMITEGDIPIKQIKELRDVIIAARDYLLNCSLGSLDERILLNDTAAALIALAALDYRPDGEPL